VVKAGKARYIGASSMQAWEFSKALHLAERHGWTRFSTMQNYVNLLYREEEREMLPLCRDAGIGVIPWSPLARGRLARPWNTQSARTETDNFGRTLYANTAEADRQVVEAVGAVAAQIGAPMAQVALAWVLQKVEVSAPIVGATRIEQLDDAVAALALTLTPEQVQALEAPYVPHAVVGIVT
jgi:aryl-alcohol dehydrogenase-like predicted oxidoreductase